MNLGYGYMSNNPHVLNLQSSREHREVKVVKEASFGLTVSEKAGINADNLKEIPLLDKVIEKLQHRLAQAKEQIFVAAYPHNKQYLNDQVEYTDALKLVMSCIKNPGIDFCGKLVLESKNDKLVQCFVEAKGEYTSNRVQPRKNLYH